MSQLFDVYIAVDWTARNVASPARPVRDALWVGEKDILADEQKETYWRTRYECITHLQSILHAHVQQHKRVLIGYDFGLGYPAGFVEALGLDGDEAPWRRMWDTLAQCIHDDPANKNNRFEVASKLNALCMRAEHGASGPLWGCPVGQAKQSLASTSPQYPFVTSNGQALRRLRWTEVREPKAQPVWKLYGVASVGGQTLVGIPAVHRLRYDDALASCSRVWPFETGFSSTVVPNDMPFILHVEIWPGLLGTRLDPQVAIRDQAQVRATVEWLHQSDQCGALRTLLEPPPGLPPSAIKECVEEEGWLLGSGLSKVIAGPHTPPCQSPVPPYNSLLPNQPR